MIGFAALWAPFGYAPTDEIFVTFGISATEFARRLREAMRGTAATGKMMELLEDLECTSDEFSCAATCARFEPRSATGATDSEGAHDGP
ncbi:hypothetical protein CSW57_00020 [Williamsia muralis]|uniref:Uncharacterized protein n=1 Tax=Williamsia marianensis TaxID=85044 RepID=A0A2G3PT78_WILMA|nr:hypothetical protein CSW57_00020 [Williamsia marianensis]